MANASVSQIGPELWSALYRHAEEAYPEECCGILLGPKGTAEITSLRRCRNVYDQYHKEDPVQFPRTAKTAYLMDPKEMLALQKETRASGEAMKIVYHSHVDVGAYFSEEDKRVAAFDGQPVYPGVDYLVISSREGGADGAALFSWNAETRDYILTKSFDRTPQ